MKRQHEANGESVILSEACQFRSRIGSAKSKDPYEPMNLRAQVVGIPLGLALSRAEVEARLRGASG